MTTTTVTPETQALQQEVNRLRTENTTLRNTLASTREQHTAFLHRMSRRAYDEAKQHGWCEVARELVEDLGGTWPASTYEVTYTRTCVVRYRTEDPDFEDMDFDSHGKGTFPDEPDTAYETCQIDDDGWEIDSIEEVED